MPYILNKTNGSVLATVADGTINQSTDLTFVGKNYAGYGGFIDENFLHLLENFANKSQPPKAIVGQLWYDSSNKKLKVYDGSSFVSLAYTSYSSNGSSPTNLSTGDLWFDQSQNVLNVYTGAKWLPVGSGGTGGTGGGGGGGGSAVTLSTIKDPLGNDHYIAKHIVPVNSVDVVVAITSSEDINVSTSTSIYSNFPTLRKGITLADTDPDGKSATGTAFGSGYYFWGTSGSSLKLTDGTRNYDPGEFLLKDEYQAGLLNGLSLTNNDNGVLVGTGGVFRFHADHGNSEGKMTGVNATKISFNLQYNNTTTNILMIDGNSLIPGTGNNVPRVYLGNTNNRFANIYATTMTTVTLNSTNIVATAGAFNTVSGTFAGNLTGNVTGNLYGNIIGGVDGTGSSGVVTQLLTTGASSTAGTIRGRWAVESGSSISLITQSISAGAAATAGSITGKWSLSSGSSLQATYADLAERYAADAAYDFGTVLIVGGEKEVTVTTERASIAVAGIVSQNPAYMLNSEAGNDETHPYIALKGRVWCKVTGTVNKGDLLVTSNMAGVACVWQPGDDANAVIGKALGTSIGPVGLIEVKV